MYQSINEIWEEADSNPVAYNRMWEHHPPQYCGVMCRINEENWTRSFVSKYLPEFALVFKIVCTRQFGEYILTCGGILADVNLDIKPSGSQEADFLQAANRAEYFLWDLFHKAAEAMQPLPF